MSGADPAREPRLRSSLGRRLRWIQLAANLAATGGTSASSDSLHSNSSPVADDEKVEMQGWRQGTQPTPADAIDSLNLL